MKKYMHYIAALLVILAASPAYAVLRIDITQGNVEPMPIAFTNLTGKTAEAQKIGADIMSVISADLERSGLFRPIDKAAFIQQITDGHALPNFPSWKQINANALVTGAISIRGDGKVEVGMRLWDVFGEQQIAGQSLVTVRSNWRRVAHMFADEIYKRLTGEEGYFDSRVVYVAESGGPRNRVKRLAVMDQDGANHKFLTDGRFLVLTPRFSPTTQEITYFSYESGVPRVYLLDTLTGRQRIIGDFPGMTFAPRFSPDGKKVVMSVSLQGNSELYEMELRSMRKRRLTNDPAIDTSPSYAPDGQRITFTSDRGGTPQIYVMNLDGGNLHRISFGKGYYQTPVWSPRGDLIAFTRQHGGEFFIGVMKPDGSGERLLTRGFLVEGPTWSPNGRVIMFTRQERNGKSKIHSIDLTGYNEREVITPLEASDPAWSPLLP